MPSRASSTLRVPRGAAAVAAALVLAAALGALLTVALLQWRQARARAPLTAGAAPARAPLPPAPPPASGAYLHKRSSCFSCERQAAPGAEWAAQPSKCFSCERQLQGAGGDAPFRASRSWHTA